MSQISVNVNLKDAYVFFAYRPGRGANVLHDTLGEFKGKLQSDGYSAYTAYLKEHADVELVSCLAHIRRKFFDARSNHRELAEQALVAIQHLYRVERACRQYGLPPEKRQQLRDRFSRPTFETLLKWVDFQLNAGVVRGGLKTALGYAKNHLPRLRHYLEDGRIEIDNNQIENKIRPLALGRKNYMFAGSNQAAQRAAMMYSFFATCKEHDVNPRDWLRDVLVRVGHTRPSQMAELLPGAWKANRERRDL